MTMVAPAVVMKELEEDAGRGRMRWGDRWGKQGDEKGG